MKHEFNSIRYFGKLLLSLLSTLFIILISISCSSSNQEMQVAGFRFTYEGNNYYIKSIYCPNNPQSCNHLISKDFEALDINQDRVIDKIVKGDISLDETQKIYTYALNLLEEENKLNTIADDDKELKYTLDYPSILFEITSFQPDVGDPFNQFKIFQKRMGRDNDISLFNDLKADGSLDERLSGLYSIVEAQKQYQETIEEGIRDNKISKVENLIRVK